jgi:hypothetical protein
MPEHDAAWLGKTESGRLPKGQAHAWAQTNRGQKGTNLTLQLHADELQFNVDGWNAVQAQRLAAWLIAHPANAPDLGLVIHERRAKRDHKGEPFFMGATSTTLMTFTADEVRAGDFSKWLGQWHSEADHTWTRLAYHLRRAWPRHEVLTRGEHIGPEIAALAAQSVPLLRAINGWKGPPPSSDASATVKHLADSVAPPDLAHESEDMGGLEFEGHYNITGRRMPQILEPGEEPIVYGDDGKPVEDCPARETAAVVSQRYRHVALGATMTQWLRARDIPTYNWLSRDSSSRSPSSQSTTTGDSRPLNPRIDEKNTLLPLRPRLSV